jgi:hypothetical protein
MAGDRNSTHTRVTPFFNELHKRDPTGLSWLLELMHISGRFDSGPTLAIPQPGAILEGQWTGYAGPGSKKEKSLPAPQSLLLWLVQHPEALTDHPPPDLGIKKGETPEKEVTQKENRDKRRAILQGRYQEAVDALLQSGTQAKKWFILEGPTYPDVYIRTESLVLVIEGKRTEGGTTKASQWQKVRHQLLRHMDCAWEATTLPVFGMFIVEGAPDGDPKSIGVPAKWIAEAKAEVSPQALDGSFPHRSPQRRSQLAKGFLGVTTWQTVCHQLGVPWETFK